MTVQLYTIWKRNFRGASTNEKLSGISILNAKGTVLKGINDSLSVHFCQNKYNSSHHTLEMLVLFIHWFALLLDYWFEMVAFVVLYWWWVEIAEASIYYNRKSHWEERKKKQSITMKGEAEKRKKMIDR